MRNPGERAARAATAAILLVYVAATAALDLRLRLKRFLCRNVLHRRQIRRILGDPPPGVRLRFYCRRCYETYTDPPRWSGPGRMAGGLRSGYVWFGGGGPGGWSVFLDWRNRIAQRFYRRGGRRYHWSAILRTVNQAIPPPPVGQILWSGDAWMPEGLFRILMNLRAIRAVFPPHSDPE
jgi:hypothetical protein